MNRLIVSPCFLVLCLLPFAVVRAADKETAETASGVIEHVTVYRDQALVTRRLKLPVGEGLQTLRIADLPESLISESMYAEGEDGVTVRALRVAARVVTESKHDEVRELEREQDSINQKLAISQQQIEVFSLNRLALDRAFSFSVTKGNDDLNHGVLNVDALIKMTEFSDDRRQKLSLARQNLQHLVDQLQRQLESNQQRLQYLASHGNQKIYEATLFVENENDAQSELRVNYRVGGCGWSPQYTIHGTRGVDKYALRYGALVTQTSGEDWESVHLSLSNASPLSSCAGPILTPFRITTIEESESKVSLAEAELNEQLQLLREQQRYAEVADDHQGPAPNDDQRDIRLNSFALQMQRLDLLAAADSARGLALDATDEVSTQTYRIDPLVSMKSRRDQQLVAIANMELTGNMYHIATPLLSSYGYRQAELQNSDTLALIGGPAMVFLDGRFVGRTQIPATARSQKLGVGFGADQQIRTRRELLQKSDVVHGGNRRIQFKYRIVVSNFNHEPVTVRVLDRLPTAKESQALSLQLDPLQQPLSPDGLYVRMRRPLGILRWDVDVPAGRHGSDAFDIDYGFTAEFDRNHQLSTDLAANSLQADYEMEKSNFGGGMGGGGFH